MTDTLDKIAQAICTEQCAFMGEPPCHAFEEHWPNKACDEPGCQALAKVALDIAVDLAAEIAGLWSPDEAKRRILEMKDK